MLVQRFDRGELRKPKILPNGFLRADAYLTRIGVFQYRNADGSSRRELRLPDEVFNDDSLDTARGTALTLGHPTGPVTTDNARDLSIGHVSVDVRREDEKVRATVTIQDAKATKVMKGGAREISCGYWCDFEPTAGVTKDIEGIPDGLKYDGIQRNIVYNHVAAVPRGRAGPDVHARMDAATWRVDADGGDIAWLVDDDDDTSTSGRDNDDGTKRKDHLGSALGALLMQRKHSLGLTITELATSAAVTENGMDFILSGEVLPTGLQIEGLAELLDVSADELKNLLPERQREQLDAREDKKMPKFKLTLDGVTFEYEADASAEQAIRKKLTDDSDAIKVGSEKLSTTVKVHGEDIAKEKARADGAEEKLETATADLAKAQDPEAVRKRIDERLTLERNGKTILGDAFDVKLDDEALQRAIVLKVHPKAKLDSVEPAYLQARFDAAVEDAAKTASDDKDVGDANGDVRRAANSPITITSGSTRVDKAADEAKERNAKAWQQPLSSAAK